MSNRPLRILIVTSEAVPYAKTGGLADVLGVLPQRLQQRGHDVRVVMPRYYEIDRRGLAPALDWLSVPMGTLGHEGCPVLRSRLPPGEESAPPVYFLDREAYYGRAGIYNDARGQGFGDNDRRYVFLSRGALALCHAIDFTPDVIHVNDWQTAAIPVLLNTQHRHDPRLRAAASVLTVHNIQYQGMFGPQVMDLLGVGWGLFNPRDLEHNGAVNLLKGGLYHATLINTVSEGYAREIRQPAYGHGLDGVVRDRGSAVRGILNGIDEVTWDPARDPLIAAPYSADDLRGKAACKAALQRRVGLPERADVPVIGMIGRLVKQKGIDVVAEALPHLLRLNAQFVMLGSGEMWAHSYFGDMARRHPGRFACELGYDEALAHQIEAGSDFFLMPSRFEPCGLNQLYSLRYGTLPIVRATGGLDDTVDNLEPGAGWGTGFKLHDLDARALFNTVGWALHTYYNEPEEMQGMIQRAMHQDFSWARSTQAYEALFREAVWRRTGRAA